jgi:hypothetical protein
MRASKASSGEDRGARRGGAGSAQWGCFRLAQPQAAQSLAELAERDLDPGALRRHPDRHRIRRRSGSLVVRDARQPLARLSRHVGRLPVEAGA